MHLPIKIMIVDDHALLTSGLEMLLNDDDDYEVVATAKNPEDAIDLAQGLIPTAQLDLVLMDIEFENKQQEGFACAKEILHISKLSLKQTKVIMLTAYRNEGFIERTRRAGIPGYLHKNCPREKMKKAITIVINGGSYYDDGHINNESEEEEEDLNKSLEPIEISEKEKKVLILIAKKKNNAEIADILNTSEKTIERIKTKLYAKFKVTNAVGLVVEAIKQGFLNPGDL